MLKYRGTNLYVFVGHHRPEDATVLMGMLAKPKTYATIKCNKIGEINI